MKAWAIGLLALGVGLGQSHAVRADTAVTLPSHTVVVSTDERVLLTFDPIKGPREISRGPVSAADKPDTATLSRTEETLQSLPLSGALPSAGVLAASLWSSQDGGTQLRADNGYDFPVIYRAFLVFERAGQRRYVPTSICPVRPGHVGFESWGDHVVAIAMTGFEAVSPDNMACNDGSVLTTSAEPPKTDALYSCSGGEVASQLSPLTVALTVDDAGAIHNATATWSLSAGEITKSPVLQFEYPLEGDVPVHWPNGLSILAVAGMDPPPKAMAATIVLSLNGVEKISRPWGMYAKARASIAAAPNHPVAVYGVIPFFPHAANPADAGLSELLHAVGEPGGVVAVRIVGDDGAVLAAASYSIDQPAVRSKAAIDAALGEALAKAKTPTQCQKQAD
jgi:hypothetical protein